MRRTWVLGGGGGRGAAQVGALLALFESGIEPPERLIGVSVGALNAAVIGAYPSRAGAAMLRELWLSKRAQDVFRANPLDLVLSRLFGSGMAALPATNVTRVIERAIQLTGIETFEGLKVPMQVLATDVNAGGAHVFSSGALAPALQATTAVPGVFPSVEIEERGYLDGGVVDNLPISLAVEQGSRDVLGIALMAGGELDHQPIGWAELMGRTLQLTMHHRMLSDFERLRDRARVVLLCPVMGPGEGMDLRREHVAELIDGAERATLHLLQDQGQRLYSRSGIHYLDIR